MSRIHSNVPALQAIHRLHRNYEDLSLRLERLATGLRINRGADDPAGLIASERLRMEIRGIGQAIENSGRAANVISVTESALAEANALLLDLQALIVQSANEAALSDEEVRANQLQVDSILTSLDRIANTTTFAGKKLLDGSEAYVTSNTPASALPSVQLFSVRVPDSGVRNVRVEVTQSAQTAQLSFVGSNPGGASTTSATTVVIRGTIGSEVLTFASGATMDQIADAINNLTISTGVSATVSGPGGVASALTLQSTTLGADAFVSVAPIAGNFIEANNGMTLRGDGVDATVIVDGQKAAVSGLEAEVRTGGLDAKFILSRTFAQTLSSAEFSVTGGGSLFQLTPQVTPNGQIHVGLNAISTTELGDPVTGLLYSLRSGADNSLDSGNFLTAQNIVREALSQVAFYRGRLGTIQHNQIETNINSQRIALENVTASESVIRDADMAEEVANLTRAQVLVQSTQATLQIANTLPGLVLSLLNG